MVYELDFGSDCIWRAVVTDSRLDSVFELRMIDADSDWKDTVVGFAMSASGPGTQLRFYHRGWAEPNEHYRVSCHCWAMYLRILRRHLEYGETVPYEKRNEV